MAKKKKSTPMIKAEATAKAELVAKASYQRNHTISEIVPPDVTRAKAGAWLALISPITEWAGLRGDKLRAKRELFRVQQEATLLQVAAAVRRKIDGHEIKPVAPKLLVPALEKASLEDPQDTSMIERWAELLASASQQATVQPRFVSILGELAGSQAECLEMIAFNNFKKYNFPGVIFDGVPYEYADHAYGRSIKERVANALGNTADVQDLVYRVAAQLNRPSVFPELVIMVRGKDWYEYDTVRQTGVRREGDLAILESIGLIRRVVIEFSCSIVDSIVDVSIYYYHLTQLGVDFCGVCARGQLQELEKIDEVSRAEGRDRDDRSL